MTPFCPKVPIEILAGRQEVVSGAEVLALSARHMHRLLARYREGGDGLLVHKAGGLRSNKQLIAVVRESALDLVRQSYRDFGRHLRPKRGLSGMGSRWAVRRSASECPPLGCGCRVSGVGRSISKTPARVPARASPDRWL